MHHDSAGKRPISGKVKFAKEGAFKEGLPFSVTESDSAAFSVGGVSDLHLARTDSHLNARAALAP
jgi:hypothetical protein